MKQKLINYQTIKNYSLIAVVVTLCFKAEAQEFRELTLNDAITMGIANSKTLKLSQAKVDEAISRFNQTNDLIYPTGNLSYAYNHAEIPTSTLQIGTSTIRLPNRADAFIGTFALQELIFAGNKLRYAKESTQLLTQVARLDADRNKDDIVSAIIASYYDLYRIQQSKKVVEQNLQAVAKQVTQSQRFFDQGIVTKNDVLRFQLQQSNIELTGIDLETNRKIVNYNLDLLLGLPENTAVNVGSFQNTLPQSNTLSAYIDSALNSRKEIKAYQFQTQLAEKNISTIKADAKPTVGVGLNAYYINAGGKLLPAANSFIAPITVGASVGWNFDRLWMNKNKIAEAKIKQSEADLGRSIEIDNVKNDVNRNYQNYQMSLNKIKVLQTSIAQAQENDRILESKYTNNIASVTERLDAQTQLFQTLINLELAKADAGLAYYNLLKSTGTITKTNF